MLGRLLHQRRQRRRPGTQRLAAALAHHGVGIRQPLGSGAYDLGVGDPNSVLAQSSPGQFYQTVTNANLTTFNPQAISITGGSQPHNNMMPYIVLTAIIALQGIFPARS